MSTNEDSRFSNLASKTLRRTSGLLLSHRRTASTNAVEKGRPQPPSPSSPPVSYEKKNSRRVSDNSLGSAFTTLRRHLSVQRAPSTRKARNPPDTFDSLPTVEPSPQPPIIQPKAAASTLDTGISDDTQYSTHRDEISPVAALQDAVHGRPQNADDVRVPSLLQNGIPMSKISEKGSKSRKFKIDPDQGLILWPSKKSGIITIENIKEMRAGEHGRYYRERFKLPADVEDRWMTIVYLADGKYKTLHLVAETRDHFQMWHDTLKQLHAVRAELMTGLGHFERRENLWERYYWKGADFSKDQALDFEEVKHLCRRLNLGEHCVDLRKHFDDADSRKAGQLSFEDFQRFVRGLKRRPEIKKLFRRLKGKGEFTFEVFEKFVREDQKETHHSRSDLEAAFRKYASPVLANKALPAIPTPGDVTPIPTPKHASRNPSSDGHGKNAFESYSNPLYSTALGWNSLKSRLIQFSQQYGRHSLSPVSTPQPPHSVSSPTNATPHDHTKIPVEYLTFNLESFISYLMSADNSPFAEHHAGIHQDMTRPLADYYISSSHNTYLVGHQLVGVSTIEGYIRALLHGCRSVEIDIYDGEEEPVITHGLTLTSKVPLRDICQAIAKYAFVASPYPIIISAEVHCSLEQQDMIASIMKECFGEALVDQPIHDHNEKGIQVLPSPEQLRHRILLKAKNLYVTESRPLDEHAVVVDPAGESSTESTTSDDPETKPSRRALSFVRRRGKSTSSSGSSPKESTFPAPTSNTGVAEVTAVTVTRSSSTPATVNPANPPKRRMSMALLGLLVYTVGVKCRGINKKERYAVEHVFSLSEKTANKILKQSVRDLIKHNRTHVVRIYPKGMRVSSSNYPPHRFWAAGCQLVAINWQTFDLGYMINHSMFQRNGGCGYVLKPEVLRSKDKAALVTRKAHTLRVTVISAQQLPRPKDSNGREIVNKSIIDPFVQVSLHVPDWMNSANNSKTSLSESPVLVRNDTFQSVAEESSTQDPPVQDKDRQDQIALRRSTSPAKTIVESTKVIKDNGFNPRWDELITLNFDVVGDMKDLVFVRFIVRDEGDEDEDPPVAVYCTPLGSLRQGYRHLPLYDQQMSQYLFSTLFVHIDLQ